MKIQCNVCEATEANVLCCADEAALCWACDEKVHAANKLASKHQRVPLLNSSSQMPKCDICQKIVGYFFCLEDRALLCGKCDVAIHSVNHHVSGHQRFLLTGVKVGLEPSEPGGSSTEDKPNSVERTKDRVSQSVSRRGTSISLTGETNEVLSRQVGGLPMTKMSFSGGSTTGSIPEWPLDDFLAVTDFNQSYGFMEHGSSKDDSGKLGDCDFSSQVSNGDLYVDECPMSKVLEIPRVVPDIPSSHTASGLFRPKSFQSSPSDNAAFVPDLCCSSSSNFQRISKRQRQ